MAAFTPVNHKCSIYHCFPSIHNQDDPDNDDISDVCNVLLETHQHPVLILSKEGRH
jgi:hypothetical protein